MTMANIPALGTLHFTRETPSESVLSDVQSLNKFNEEQFHQLTAAVILFLAEPSKSSWFRDQLDLFSEQHEVNLTHLRNAIKSFLSILSGCLRLNLDADVIKDDLTTLGLHEDKALQFTDKWRESQSTLTKAALSQTLVVNQLVDMEWKFGVTAASSQMSKVGSTFLQMKLVINKGHATENVYMELTLPQFYSFLHEMEKAKSSLEFLS